MSELLRTASTRRSYKDDPRLKSVPHTHRPKSIEGTTCTCTSLLHCEARTAGHAHARTLVLYHVARSLCFLRGFAWVQQRTTVCVAEVLAVVVIPSRQVEAGLESSWFHLVVAACVIERVVLLSALHGRRQHAACACGTPCA